MKRFTLGLLLVACTGLFLACSGTGHYQDPPIPLKNGTYSNEGLVLRDDSLHCSYKPLDGRAEVTGTLENTNQRRVDVIVGFGIYDDMDQQVTEALDAKTLAPGERWTFRAWGFYNADRHPGKLTYRLTCLQADEPLEQTKPGNSSAASPTTKV